MARQSERARERERGIATRLPGIGQNFEQPMWGPIEVSGAVIGYR